MDSPFVYHGGIQGIHPQHPENGKSHRDSKVLNGFDGTSSMKPSRMSMEPSSVMVINQKCQFRFFSPLNFFSTIGKSREIRNVLP